MSLQSCLVVALLATLCVVTESTYIQGNKPSSKDTSLHEAV